MNMEEMDAVRIVWNFHKMHHRLGNADLIWALGSHDLRVADRVAELWFEKRAPRIIMSGGLGNFTAGHFTRPEAELFAERAITLGVPENVILLEPESSNTGENVSFTRALLDREEIDVRSVIAVQKPYMERRTYATIRKQWPEIVVQVTSPDLDFDAYCDGNIAREDVIHIMVGDLHRIVEYPKRGFMIEQEVPKIVREAWQFLVDAGYNNHLLA